MAKKFVHPQPVPRKELSDNPIKLCHEISRISRAMIRENCDMDGVMSQHGARLVLSALAIGDGINQRTVVERTHLRAPTVSVILRKMQEEQMVSFESDGKDMRSKLIYLTEKGCEVDRQSIQKIKAVDKLGLEGLDQEQTQKLMELLSKIRGNLLNAQNS